MNNAAWARFGAGYAQSLERVQLAYAVNLFAPPPPRTARHPGNEGARWRLDPQPVERDQHPPRPAPYGPEDRADRFHTTHSPTLYGSTKAALETPEHRHGDGARRRPHRGVHPGAGGRPVASEGALVSGSIDDLAHMEPVEAMAEAALALVLAPAGRALGPGSR